MPILNDEQIVALLNLPGVGPKTASAVVNFSEQNGGFSGDLFAISHHARSAGIRIPDIDVHAVALALDEARRVLDSLVGFGGTIISHHSPHFPPLLRTIPNPPLILFCLGNPGVLVDRPTVAVVGTREPSPYGIKWGRRIAEVMGAAGFTIVSGLAEGCDTAAHLGALDASAPTVAFLAHGFGRIYPKSNSALAERIVADGGCLATEYAPGSPPRRSSFVERDRLQSGASRGIVIVETDVEGGTMHTVGFAKLQNRLIAALRHSPAMAELPKSRGNQQLISEGIALPIGTKEEVSMLMQKLLGRSSAQGPIHVTSPVKPSRDGQLRFLP